MARRRKRLTDYLLYASSEWTRSGTRAALEALSPSRFIKHHVAPLLYRWIQKANDKTGRDAIFRKEAQFWQASQGLALSTVSLREFQLLECIGPALAPRC